MGRIEEIEQLIAANPMTTEAADDRCSMAIDWLRALLPIVKAAQTFTAHFNTSAWGDMDSETSDNFAKLQAALAALETPVDTA